MRQPSTDTGTPSVTGRTVLVTGGAGFVGSHIVDALVDENEVRVLDDLSNGSAENVPDGATLHTGDLRDETTLAAAMAGVDLVFHQAGLVSVPASVDDPVESHQRNVDATLSLLEHARAEDARVVLASSVAIYGTPDSVPIREGAPKTPQSPYGVDKLALDHYARVYAEQYDLETVSLRYFNVYGPRQAGGEYSGVISTFLEQATAGQALTVEGDGTQTRDFVHVADVVRANLAAATTDATGRAFNVGTGDSTTIRELAEIVRDAVDPTVDIVHTPPRPADIERSAADTTRARRDLGFEATIPIDEGLRALAGAPVVE